MNPFADLGATLRRHVYESHTPRSIRLTKPNYLRRSFDSCLRVRELDPKVYPHQAVERANGLKRHAFLTQVENNSAIICANIHKCQVSYLPTHVVPTIERRCRVIRVTWRV